MVDSGQKGDSTVLLLPFYGVVVDVGGLNTLHSIQQKLRENLILSQADLRSILLAQVAETISQLSRLK